MADDVESYIELVPVDRIERFKALHDLILELYPHVKVDMSYKMPTYQVDSGWVALANQKNYISLYTCGYHHIKEFKASHAGIKTGKGCINFKDSDDIPTDDVRKVIIHAIENPKQK